MLTVKEIRNVNLVDVQRRNFQIFGFKMNSNYCLSYRQGHQSIDKGLVKRDNGDFITSGMPYQSRSDTSRHP